MKEDNPIIPLEYLLKRKKDTTLSFKILLARKIKLEREEYNTKNVVLAPLLSASSIMSPGKMIIDSGLINSDPEMLYAILDRMVEGKSLTEEQRQHVITAEEFYRANANIFLERANSTANTARELRFIRRLLKRYKLQKRPILDLGCGMGRLTGPLLVEGFEVSGLDLSSDLINLAKKAYPQYADRFFTGNLLQTPFPKNSFCFVLMMWHVICEVHDRLNLVFKEISRVLVNGGILIIDFPDVNSDDTKLYYKKRDADTEDFSLFLAKVPVMGVLKEKLEKYGFKIKRIAHPRWGVHKYVLIVQKFDGMAMGYAKINKTKYSMG